ncbi:hypothetical protein, partial [Bradyrhizobium japonicum]|uniref:hypothetical protein n=2 Tax=Bradyrhizobium TaxID=374 RepID=UPI001AEC378C
LRRQYPTKARHSNRMTMVAISALPSPAIILKSFGASNHRGRVDVPKYQVNNCSGIIIRSAV